MATYNFNTSTIDTKEGQRSLLSRTFLYMFGFLMITTAVSLVLSIILQNCGLSTNIGAIPESTKRAYTIMTISASITQLILVFVIAFGSIRQGKTNVIPMILYAICMGVLISSFAIYLKWWTIAMAFGIAGLMFGGMSLIGYFSKNASGLGMVGCGLMFAVLLTSLFNILFVFILPAGVWGMMNIVTSSVIVLAILLITAYDVWQIKAISERGIDCPNLALYLAFNLYLDFIVVLIHILRFLAIFVRDN